MDNILLLLSLFAVVKSLFMTSLLPNRWYRLAFSLSLGAFIMLCHPYAMEVNKLELQRVLSSQSAMMNISLVVMVDMLLSCYFCIARIKDWEDSKSFRWYTKLFRYMPSLLVFPALYYIHITLFEDILALLQKQPPMTCGFIGQCQPNFIIEANGSVYPCDFYALDDYVRTGFLLYA